MHAGIGGALCEGDEATHISSTSTVSKASFNWTPFSPSQPFDCVSPPYPSRRITNACLRQHLQVRRCAVGRSFMKLSSG